MKSIVAFALLTLFTFSAYAAEPEVVSYECTIRIFAATVADGFGEQTFSRPIQNGAHGGGSVDVEFGEHLVSIIADGKWRNVSWWYKGELISATVSAGTDIIAGSHAVIIYNPKNTEEQVALDCSPVLATSAL